jgi:hypothetical protein
MSKKYKGTGCARFFVILLILIPTAYFGAKMIRGGEGIPAVEDFIESIFNRQDDQSDIKDADGHRVVTDEGERQRIMKENLLLQRRITELEDELEEVKAELNRLKEGN